MLGNITRENIKESECQVELINEALNESEQQLQILINAIPDFVNFKDGEGKWIAANQFALQLCQLENVDYVGKKNSELAEMTEFYREALLFCEKSEEEAWNAGTTIRVEEVWPMPNETSKVFDVIKVPMFQPTGERKGLVVIGRDITDRKEAEDRIQHMLYYDELTGLGNQKLFQDCLTQSINQAKRTEQTLAVMSLNLDRFKFVNDSFGYATGDLFLQNVAKLLTKTISREGFVSRIGDDEFAIILPNTTHKEASAKAQQLLNAFERPFIFHEKEVFITLSIGVSCYPLDGSDADTLLHNTYSAMLQAKENRSGYQFFANHMNEIFSRRVQLEKSLYKALVHKDFHLHYQPQIDLKIGRITGVEALIRWQHPELGSVSPAEFIPIAEEMGLIIPIGEYVLRTACEQHKKWLEAGLPPIRVAVNFSALQFQQRDLVSMVTGVLKDTKLDPQYLELEITESVAMYNVEDVVEKLHSLKKLGIETSIDDFGTGYSSLGYLQTFPIGALKIERSFVQQMTENKGSKSIVRAIINLAHNLNIKVTAEGIETIEHLKFLKRYKCDKGQGYFISRPLSAEKFKEMYVSIKEVAVSVL